MKKILQSVLGVLFISLFVGCADAEVHKLINIKPNQTAYLVKLTGDNLGEGQGKFMSVDYLNKNKIATKQLEMPVRKHSTGRWWWQMEWVDDAALIITDRTLVTRVWTKSEKSGTSASDQAIGVESKDSINFRVGVNCTASIMEENAALFQYRYAGKPLSEVMDENVRGFVQGILSREFGKRNLEECKTEKGIIFAQAATETTEYFVKFGVTIENLGSSEGLNYDDPAIQTAINKKISAEMDAQVAIQEQTAQKTRNQTGIDKATAARQQAEQFAKAQEAQTRQIELEIAKIRADAMLVAAGRWSGNLPASVLPTGSPLLFGLDTPAK